MAVSVEGSGTQTATVTTEHTLDTISVEGVFVFEVDTANMVAGDVLELRVKKAMLASGTIRTFLYAMFTGAQPTDDVIKASVPFVLDGTATAATVTLKQTQGTGRAFPWVVKKL